MQMYVNTIGNGKSTALLVHSYMYIYHCLLPGIHASVKYMKTSGECQDYTDLHIVIQQQLASHIACTVVRIYTHS